MSFYSFHTTHTEIWEFNIEVLGLIIITFGIYLIEWFYKRTEEFTYIDRFSPNPQRAATVLFIIPLGWLIISKIIKKLIFTGIIGEIIEIIGWGLILFLIIKFIFDFCISFGRITKTNGIYWFLILLTGTIGIICTILQIYILSILTISIILTIPAMQLELNSHFNKMTIKKNSNIFYD